MERRERAGQPDVRWLRAGPGRDRLPGRRAAPGGGRDDRQDPRRGLAGGVPDQQSVARRGQLRPAPGPPGHPGAAARRGDPARRAHRLPGAAAPGPGRAHDRGAAGRRDAGRGGDQGHHRPGRGRGGRGLVRPHVRLRQAAAGLPRGPPPRRGDRGHQPRPVLPDPRRRAARLRGDAGRAGSVHRGPGRGHRRQAERAHGGRVAAPAGRARRRRRRRRRPAVDRRRAGPGSGHEQRAGPVRRHRRRRAGRLAAAPRPRHRRHRLAAARRPRRRPERGVIR
jgi:hypothetical protein